MIPDLSWKRPLAYLGRTRRAAPTLRRLLPSLVAVLLVACATNPNLQENVAEKGDYLVGDAYKIGKGDILEIITWKEQEFTREVPVRIDGYISFPLIEDIPAAGRTTAEVRDDIAERLKQFIKHPVVSVAVKNPVSQRFYILGEVLKPGEYPLLKNLTVVQAFALAGGFSEWASRDDIVLIRREDGEDIVTEIDYNKIVRGEELEKNVLIKADDILIVP